MNIYKAVRKAISTNKVIRRKSWAKDIYLEPTNSPNCCVLITPKGIYARWQPFAKDLIATDWVIIDEP